MRAGEQIADLIVRSGRVPARAAGSLLPWRGPRLWGKGVPVRGETGESLSVHPIWAASSETALPSLVSCRFSRGVWSDLSARRGAAPDVLLLSLFPLLDLTWISISQDKRARVQ